MEIWILVIALLAVAILLFVLSMFAKEGNTLNDKVDALTAQQSQELYQLKTRIAELERDTQAFVSTTPVIAEVELEEVIEIESVSDLTKEEVIRLYSQGYTMTEIAAEVALNVATVQQIIDDYIENR